MFIRNKRTKDQKQKDSIETIAFMIFAGIFLVIPFEASAFQRESGPWFEDRRSTKENPVKIKQSPIDFGTVLINRKSGKVNMDRTGEITFSGGVLQVYGFPQPGTLTIKAKKGSIVTITPDSSVVLGEGVIFTPVLDNTIVNLSANHEVITIFGSINFDKNTKTENLQGLLEISIDYN